MEVTARDPAAGEAGRCATNNHVITCCYVRIVRHDGVGSSSTRDPRSGSPWLRARRSPCGGCCPRRSWPCRRCTPRLPAVRWTCMPARSPPAPPERPRSPTDVQAAAADTRTGRWRRPAGHCPVIAPGRRAGVGRRRGRRRCPVTVKMQGAGTVTTCLGGAAVPAAASATAPVGRARSAAASRRPAAAVARKFARRPHARRLATRARARVAPCEPHRRTRGAPCAR